MLSVVRVYPSPVEVKYGDVKKWRYTGDADDGGSSRCNCLQCLLL